MEEHRHPVYDTDAQRREKLFEQLFYEPSMRETIRHCRITFHTFDDVVSYLNNEALTVHHYNRTQAITKSRARRMNFTDIDDADAESSARPSDHTQLLALLSQRLPNSYIVPKNLFYCIPESARQEFLDNRNLLFK